MFRVLIAIFACAVLALPALADPYRVVDVHDGDGTYTVEPPQGGDRLKVRLHGVDAPELDQPYGQAARDFAVKALLYKEVDVRQTGKHFDRIVAIVEIPGVGIMQELLLQAGLAWIEPRYCGDCKEWQAMEAEARAARRGLWAGKKPVEPWVWREMQKKKKGR